MEFGGRREFSGTPERGGRASRATVRGIGWRDALGRLLVRCTKRNERLRLCETLSLGGRRGVALIELDGQRFLAGMSASGVETLVPVDGDSGRGAAR